MSAQPGRLHEAHDGDRTLARGVDVVYDGCGPATFQGSLDAPRRSGTFRWYGPVPGGPGLLDIMSLLQSQRSPFSVGS